MAIWTSEIKELEKLYESLKGQLPEIEKELIQLIHTEDPNVIMLYSRRSLEVIISDLCECELKRPRKTEPLKGIIDKLHKEEKVPSNIITSMHGLNELSTFGAHPKDFDPEQVKPVLNNLDIIIKWYLKHKEAGKDIEAKLTEEIKQDTERAKEIEKSIIIPKRRVIGMVSGLIFLSVIMIAVLFNTNIIGGGKQSSGLEKSIAVLPFKNIGSDAENQYIIDGTMDAILDNLCKMANLKVISRTSIEQYRNPTESISDIAKELNVNYILEGSGQKYGDDIRLTVQLIDATKDKHIWSQPYDRKISDIFTLQSEIAQKIASEIDIIVRSTEKNLIEKIPTVNFNAYDLYLKANDYLNEYYSSGKLSLYQKAITFNNAALSIDSTFAKAYTALARAYYYRYFSETYFKENFLDSCLVLADIALSFDDQLDEAYYLKGQYYQQNGRIEEALENYEKALRINPNYYAAYSSKGYLLTWVVFDYVKGIENYNKALELIRGYERQSLLMGLGRAYLYVGFIEKAKYFYKEAFNLHKNQAKYYDNLAWIEFSTANYEEALKLAEKATEINPKVLSSQIIFSILPGHNEESYDHALKLINSYKESGSLNLYQSHRVGYALYRMGKKQEAEEYFKEQIKYSEESIRLSRDISQYKAAHYDLAITYAFLGNKDKAYQYLDEFNTMNFYYLWWVNLAKNDPMLISIRNEEHFKKILQNMESKYQTEHERVRKWLEVQGML